VVAAGLLIESPEITSRVRRELGLMRLEPSEVRGLIRASPDRRTGVLSITGIGGSPEVAAAIANAFAEALLAFRTQRFQEQLERAIERTSTRAAAIGDGRNRAEAEMLSTRLADYRALTDQPDPTVELVSAAAQPAAPAWPRPLATLLVAGVGGLLLGCVVAVALEQRTPIIVRTDELAEPDGPPILARMPMLANREVRELLVDPEPASAQLRERVRPLSAVVGGLLPNWSQTRTLLITSADERDRSPAVAAVLASRIARTGMGVALVDLDLERGPLAAIVDGVANRGPSVGQLLMSTNARELLDSVAPVSSSHELRVFLARGDRHLSGWMPPHRISALARELQPRVDALVISAPPLPATESWAVLNSADAVIVVVGIGRTRRDRLTNVRQVLGLSDREPLGYVVLERPGVRESLARITSHLRRSRRRRPATL
jgi:capsular polysaccharide biosynthesis protein